MYAAQSRCDNELKANIMCQTILKRTNKAHSSTTIETATLYSVSSVIAWSSPGIEEITQKNMLVPKKSGKNQRWLKMNFHRTGESVKSANQPCKNPSNVRSTRLRAWPNQVCFWTSGGKPVSANKRLFA